MLILIRFSGEISTKAKGTRQRFTQRLINNIQSALSQHNIGHHIRRQWSRLFVEAEDARAVDVLKRVFGIRSMSIVEQHRVTSLEDICERGREFFRESVTGKKFAVRAKRIVTKTPPFTSHEIEVALGSELYPFGVGVDLENPDVTAHVELNGEEVYFFSDVIEGPGGMPLGAKGRALALVSGGFDSAVAAWMILKRGIGLDYVFLNMGGTQHLVSMLRVMKVLTANWSFGDHPKLFAIDFEEVVQELQRSSDSRYWQITLKRHMVRAAERVAGEHGHLALVTGEVIGQVSSQTLPNLNVISEATSLPIFRPLIGFDKHEIVALAKRIGTEDASAEVHEYCALDIKHPITDAKLSHVKTQEEPFDQDVLERAIATQAQFDLREIDPEAFGIKELEINEIPDGAVLLDLRTESAYRSWHLPGARFVEFLNALADPESLGLDTESDQLVIAYCEVGIKSAQLAEKLRNLGINAKHFKGGMRELMPYAIDHELIPVELLPSSIFTD